MNSFDIVSKVDLMEVSNALDQTMKEIRQRFDFKGSKSEVRLEGQDLIVISDDEYKLKSVIDILQSKLVKRGVSLKALAYGKVEEALGGMVRQRITLRQGISAEVAKAITGAIREGRFKVQIQIQGDQIRISGKSIDELQAVIVMLKGIDFDRPLQFTNYR